MGTGRAPKLARLAPLAVAKVVLDNRAGILGRVMCSWAVVSGDELWDSPLCERAGSRVPGLLCIGLIGGSPFALLGVTLAVLVVVAGELVLLARRIGRMPTPPVMACGDGALIVFSTGLLGGTGGGAPLWEPPPIERELVSLRTVEVEYPAIEF